MMSKRLSPKDYAIHRKAQGLHGSTKPAVLKALREGRLSSTSAAKEGGRWWIDPVAADEEWAESTQEAKQRDEPKGGRPRKGPQAGQGALFAGIESGPPIDPDKPGSVRESAEVEAHYRALQRRLNYAVAAGELVSAEGVRKAWADASADLLRALRNMAEGLAPTLATIDDEIRIEAMLVEQFAIALEEFKRERPARTRRSG